MTAHSMKGDREKCLAAGMDDYLSKPLRSEALDAVLARWVPEAVVADGLSRVAEGDAGSAGDGALGNGTSSVLDRAIIGELRSHLGRDGLIELMGVFTTNAPALLSKIGDAVRDKDASALEEATHTLKGSAANFGAVRMAELCTRLETFDPAADLDGASMLVDELEQALERTQSVLREELDC